MSEAQDRDLVTDFSKVSKDELRVNDDTVQTKLVEDEEDEDKDDRNRGAEDPTEEAFDDTEFNSADVVDLPDADVTHDDNGEEEAEGQGNDGPDDNGEGQGNDGPDNNGGMGV